MPAYLCLTVRFLQPYSHGRGDGGEPEWPPSPLRLFQALVAAAAARWNERTAVSYAAPALDWLADRPAPTVVAGPGTPADTPYRLYVPDNVADRVAKSWAGGGADDIANYRTEKDVRPVRLADGAAVHYLYRLAGDSHAAHVGTLAAAARSVTHLGWGVDMAAADAAVLTQEQADALPGERWRPTGDGGTVLRVPRAGTLKALRDRHAAFLGRLPAGGGFVPVPPLTAFDSVGYRRDDDPPARAVAAFELRTPDFERFQLYGTATRTAAVAGMVRNAAADYATATCPFGWTAADIAAIIHGHAPNGTAQRTGDGADDRFAFLPLPTIEPRPGGGSVVGGVRRVLVVAPPSRPAAARWVRGLSGQLLSPLNGTLPAALRLIEKPEADTVVKHYLRPARVWSTVTPVLRPGFDDREPDKALGLMRKAFVRAGFPPELVARAALEWRPVGFRAGVEHAKRFVPPDNLKGYPAYHVRVTWPADVPGPVAVGAGRYRGFGVFVADSHG